MKYFNVFLQTAGLSTLCFGAQVLLTNNDYLEIGLVTVAGAFIYALFSLLAIEEEKKHRVRKGGVHHAA